MWKETLERTTIYEGNIYKRDLAKHVKKPALHVYYETVFISFIL